MVVVFRSRLRPGVDLAAYEKRVAEVMAEARSMPGFRSISDFASEGGERVAIVEFQSETELEAWRDHALHRGAQQEGRDRFYSEYSLQVCRLVRESHFAHDPSPTA